jgi:hypothetical protein
MYYSIALYLALILPISIRKYKKDGKKSVLVKILNSLITLYVSVALSGIAGRLMPWNTKDTFLILKDVPLWINIAYTIIYTAVSAFAIFHVVKLALRMNSGRLPFLKVVPLLWVMTGIEKYYTYISMFNDTPSALYMIWSNAIYAIIWGGIFVFYRNKKTKEFFLVS